LFPWWRGQHRWILHLHGCMGGENMQSME
jgi:hypothetical protein